MSQRWQPEQKSAGFNPVGRWQSWPEARKKRFDEIAGATLQRAGYPTTHEVRQAAQRGSTRAALDAAMNGPLRKS